MVEYIAIAHKGPVTKAGFRCTSCGHVWGEGWYAAKGPPIVPQGPITIPIPADAKFFQCDQCSL